MMLDASVDSEAQAEEIVRAAKSKFAGNPGQVMFMIREGAEADTSRFIPIQSANEGDWHSLHQQATSDIVVAHSWFRALSGLDYNSGFDSERILHEYEVALNTVILIEQAERSNRFGCLSKAYWDRARPRCKSSTTRPRKPSPCT